MNILIVDDEKQVIDAFERCFTEEGHEVIAAYDVREALTRYDDGGIDVIITDLKMPVAEGKYLVDIIHTRHPHMPVIVLSGYIESEEDLKERGARYVLHKPTDPEVVLRLLAEIEKEQKGE